MLTPKQLARLRVMIAQRHEALTSEIHRDAAKSRDASYGTLAGPVGDAADNAVADQIADMDNAELSRDVRELRALEAAQERMATGKYGICVDCDSDIGMERLLVQPTAMRCIDCQTLYEKTHAQTAGPML